MLSVLPIWILIPLLVVSGAMVGAFVNWAIYSWAIIQCHSVSPWQAPAIGGRAYKMIERIPVFGWYARKRETHLRGKRFWLRPMLIELAWLVGLPLFYFWQINGGLTHGNLPPVQWGETWFFIHGLLLVLMCIGTFIDFDEKTIPDRVTVPGTIIALLLAALAPWSRLPEVIPGVAGMAEMAAPTIQAINFASPHELSGLHEGLSGLLIVAAIWTIWIWALLPKLPVWYVGFGNWLRFMVAHAARPERKTECDIRVSQRKIRPETVVLVVLFFNGLFAIAIAWVFLPATNWISLFGAFLGIAFAGGLIWAIRVLGTIALQQEAMGFGDVTLWAMVGAFLGWQASLLGFFYSPFAAIAVILFLRVTNKEGEIAFGPYLCIGAVITLIGWFTFWDRARNGVFLLGPWLGLIFCGALVAMVLMLLAITWFKGRGEGDVDEDH